MNDRKMSRRTALTLTAAAATGAAILADATPALATWPTITSPGATDTGVVGALSTVSTATRSMLENSNKASVKFQGREINSWDVVEDIVVAAAAAIAENKHEGQPEWKWRPHRVPPHPTKH